MSDFSLSVNAGLAERETLLLAPYAMHSTASAGRRHAEVGHPYRTAFQRDRDRVLHSAAYRRLSYKTQVFTGELGDYHRTRLTHTLEVACVARTIGRTLRLNEDLIEALALAHDLGHPPFGHAGEETLDSLLSDQGGFDHNRQSLRIVEVLEQRYPGFPGLNLSLEMLEGQEYRVEKRLEGPRPLLEVQVVDAADSVAYDTHDVDDALQLRLLTVEDLAAVPLWRETVERVRRRWTDLDRDELRRAAVHELIDRQVSDLLEGTRQRLAGMDLRSVEDVRRAPALIRPSLEMAEQKAELETFLFHRVYRHPQVMKVRWQAQGWLREMFVRYLAQPELMPPRFQSLAADQGMARSVGDYLSGMTDRYAQQQHETLFDRPPGC